MKRSFSVSSTADSIAPGPAIEGTASGKIAVSWPLSAIFTSCSGLLSPKIIDSANRNSTMPPAIWNADNGMSTAVRISSPATMKNTRIAADIRGACVVHLGTCSMTPPGPGTSGGAQGNGWAEGCDGAAIPRDARAPA
ncbi:hypothetical protein L3V18_12915 [Lysobacter sp. TLK-CK17T]|uniref:Uncharacterized protein n=1 Tax=Marilutibacter chinensis TaxID=2912247 RepID=A0ABS9HUV2_9GAMM|nr:hypothetical protein [Lysobacter chinensis]